MRGTISSRGRVTLPIEIREQLGLAPGTPVEFEIREEDVLLRKGPSSTHPVDQVWGTLRLDRPVDEALDDMRGTSAEESVRIDNSTIPDLIIQDGKPVAVILSLTEYRELLEKAEDLEALRRLDDFLADNARAETLDELSANFEILRKRMQTPEARKGIDAAFNATPEELGRAAAKAARRRS